MNSEGAQIQVAAMLMAAITEPMRRSATWKPSASVVFRVNISVTPIISTA